MLYSLAGNQQRRPIDIGLKVEYTTIRLEEVSVVIIKVQFDFGKGFFTHKVASYSIPYEERRWRKKHYLDENGRCKEAKIEIEPIRHDAKISLIGRCDIQYLMGRKLIIRIATDGKKELEFNGIITEIISDSLGHYTRVAVAPIPI